MMHWFGEYSFGLWHGFGWIFMILFWVLVIFGVIYVVKLLSRQGDDLTSRETAEDILKKRYARGEITKDEFDRMMKDIQS